MAASAEASNLPRADETFSHLPPPGSVFGALYVKAKLEKLGRCTIFLIWNEISEIVLVGHIRSLIGSSLPKFMAWSFRFPEVTISVARTGTRTAILGGPNWGVGSGSDGNVLKSW